MDTTERQEVVDRAAVASENARLVKELNDAKAETEALLQLADAVNRIESTDDVYALALSAVSRLLQLERSALLLLDADGVMRFKSWRGLSDEFRHAVEGRLFRNAGEQTSAPAVCADVRESPGWAALRKAHDAEGIRALANIPLAQGERPLGTLMLYREEARGFSPAELRVAQTIAGQVSLSIGRMPAAGGREALISQLAHTVKMNELLAGILGHDLRNPLGAMLMSATVLSRKLTDPTLVRTAGRILSAGQRLNRMIAQLLDFTRVRGTGTLVIECSRSDLAQVFQQAADELANSSPAPRVDIASQGDTRGFWDADRMIQVASNLLTNAIRHGADDAAVVTVRIDGDDPAFVTATVSNGGVIPSELISVIFEPFQNGQMRERRGGLGLGLFIGREIVTAHGGALSVDSAGGTTTFSVRLPREAGRGVG